MRVFAFSLMFTLVALTAAPSVVLAETSTLSPIEMTITVSGLDKGEQATLKLGAETQKETLEYPPLYEFVLEGSDGSAKETAINPSLEDGYYTLLLEGPEKYFREPKGYFFVVKNGSVLNPTGRAVTFQLIPPSARDYEPYRTPSAIPGFPTTIPPSKEGVTYRTEAFIGLSAPPKQSIELPGTEPKVFSPQWWRIHPPPWQIIAIGTLAVVVLSGLAFLCVRALRAAGRRSRHT